MYEENYYVREEISNSERQAKARRTSRVRKPAKGDEDSEGYAVSRLGEAGKSCEARRAAI